MVCESEPLRVRLRTALTGAMKSRNQIAVSVLRATLGAIDNAEAVITNHAPPDDETSREIAGGVSGLGAGEVMRRCLTEDEIAELVASEIDERRIHSAEFRALGETTHAARLDTEAKVLEAILADE